MRDSYWMAANRKPIDCRTRGIDQTHSNPFAGFHAENSRSLRGPSVDEQSDIRRHLHPHCIAATARRTTQGYWHSRQEVGQNQRVLTVVINVGLLLLHNQRAY